MQPYITPPVRPHVNIVTTQQCGEHDSCINNDNMSENMKLMSRFYLFIVFFSHVQMYK